MIHETRVVEHATCTFCGCVCDDIDLTVEPDRITRAQNACALGEAWFLGHRPGQERPEALVDGAPATTADAVAAAARLLAAARCPVVYGLADTTAEAQRAAVEVADVLGACLDTTTSVRDGASTLAMQAVGEVTCTLGEIRNRADLVIFWGADPLESHPRHWTRYSVEPRGLGVPNGRADRHVVVVDVDRTATAQAADWFLQVRPGKDFELLWALRALVKGVDVPPAIEAETGIAPTALRELAGRMARARFGALVHGTRLAPARGAHHHAAALLSLVRDLNRHTRFVAAPLRGGGNVAGADHVVAWSTGYPFGVSLGRGFPRFNPGEFTAVDLLVRGEADAALIVAADPATHFPRRALDHLRRIPTVALGARAFETARDARVAITTALYGIHVAGTVYRMDGVPIRLRPALPSRYPSDETVLRAIAQRVRELRRAAVGA